MANNINIVALVAGVLTMVLLAVSVFVPWWLFSVGAPAIAQINFSPLNFNVGLLGTTITLPIIFAFNMAALLTLLAGGIVMLIYSVKANKSYSKKLLSFRLQKTTLRRHILRRRTDCTVCFGEFFCALQLAASRFRRNPAFKPDSWRFRRRKRQRCSGWII